jgi:hypothetical protein
MQSEIPEPRLGEGVMPLFMAAMVFWFGVISLAVWLAR